MRLKLLPLLLLFASLAWPVASFAQSIGTLKVTKGAVKIRRAGKDLMFKGSKEIKIFKNDEIQTGSDSKAFVHLTRQDDRINLFSGTFFKIGAAEANATEVTMNIGKAKFKIKKPPKGKKRKRRFRVRTANAVIGVKGTEFLLGTGAEETNLMTIEGEVGFSSAATPNIEVSVEANQASRVTATGTPSAPSTVPPEVRANLLSSDSGKGWNQVKFSEPVAATEKKSEKKKEPKKEEKKEQAKKEPSKKEEPKDEKKDQAKKDGPSKRGPSQAGPSGPKVGLGGPPPPGGILPLGGLGTAAGAFGSDSEDAKADGNPPPPLGADGEPIPLGEIGPPPIGDFGETELASDDFGTELDEGLDEGLEDEFLDFDDSEITDLTDEIAEEIEVIEDEIAEVVEETSPIITITIQN